ncbi:hypothetical protein RclHR1_05160005 [Rhizophagus clarus]|uniref:Protein kinase domain-containing protein n=1 Tax=Rhizophagus clarus TaxID=94130 RepID=A0A2Z6RL44_9GLOM|nr:hypothetical protein RclHR1_05160005 [Rhizophagus clarus]
MLKTKISGNEKIDDFIQERQLRINDYKDVAFEWIPYNQFNEIKEIGESDTITVYSAIWEDGPLYKNHHLNNYSRNSNKSVSLKLVHNSKNSIEFVINKAKKYSPRNNQFLVFYGISQTPDTNDYILVFNSASGNEKIDDFIQERQLKVNHHKDVVFEWIPYNQFNEIKETGKNDNIVVYSAKWKDGPLYKTNHWSNYSRDSNKEVALKLLYNSQNSIEFIIDEVKKYLLRNDQPLVLYGISQNPDTNDYILVFNWTSGNEKIDDFIQERQLKVNNHKDVVFEWIPYNQFNEIKETGKYDTIAVYSAIWRNGPLYKKNQLGNYARDSDKEVSLKLLYNSQNSREFVINEVKKYSLRNNQFLVLYGISQNPDTNDYILVFNWTSGNEKIDDFIQERRLKVKYHNDVLFEWIPYNQFNEIKETVKNDTTVVYSAIWRNGPLYKKYQWSNYERDSNKEVALKVLHNSQNSIELVVNEKDNEYTRDSNKEVALKLMNNSQNSIEFVINEVKKYSLKNNRFLILYGISQNPVTNDYILVQNNSIILTNCTSGNEKIDEFIQKRLLKINDHKDIVFEWIPYNQFDKIKETYKNDDIAVYSTIWNNGPLTYNQKYNEYTRDSNKEVALKLMNGSQNSIEFVINEVKKYSLKNNRFLILYGISQNPVTNDYILVQNNSINLANCISGNEKIDDFIQKRLLKINDHKDILFEWIPYNQFDKIKEIGKNDNITVYSAIWNNGPLTYNQKYNEYTRDSNKEVTLKLMNDSQNSIEFVINEVKKYSPRNDLFLILYGISHTPDSNDYILVFNWTSGNEEIDDFIRKRRLKVNDHKDIVFEWIPYNQFNKIKETGKYDNIAVYSAIWDNGPLTYNQKNNEYTRDSNKEVALKLMNDSQNSIEFVINEVKKYSSRNDQLLVLYGISRNPDTNDYILVFNWTSGNERIDDFIQGMRLNVNKCNNDLVFEWISYSQFDQIKKTGKNDSMIVFSAVWRNGPLYYRHDKCIRDSNKEVALKFLGNSPNPTEFVINEVEKYLTKNSKFLILYGITQNPFTNDYILVFNWTSGNEKIDDFIQEMRVNINKGNNDLVFEWIPYSQFNGIKETSRNCLMSVYSAIWKDGPLYKNNTGYTRDSNREVVLNFLCNSQNSTEFVIDEAKKYSMKNDEFHILYGISQDPDTNDYVLVQKNFTWIGKNEKIDCFIQERLLKINKCEDVIFEWIPFDQFNHIEKIGNNNLMTIYSAVWTDGPLYYQYNKYTRNSNKTVNLKNLHNSQNFIEFVINEAEKYITNNDDFFVLYGISQNPDTNDYVLVLNWSSGNDNIDNFIQERQLKINKQFEWIPYNRFNKIRNKGNGYFITVCSATWGYREVALLCYNVYQKFLDKIQESDNSFKLYGISRNKNVNDYILVFQNDYCAEYGEKYCKNCGRIYDHIKQRWCKLCQLNSINELINRNEKFDDLIQEMQLKIDSYSDIIFEWIPYNQFNYINEIGKGGFSTVYSAMWKDGPLKYFSKEEMCIRTSNKKVALKCIDGSANLNDKFLNEVKEYSIKKMDDILNVYGISQVPTTKNFIIVLEYAEGGSYRDWMNKNYKDFDWKNRIQTLLSIIKGLKGIHQNEKVHHDLHPGNILFLTKNLNIFSKKSLFISDMGLCKDVDNTNEVKIYGVLPYTAPEVLRSEAYTKKADIYSFSMIMYFTATGKQPFINCAHDGLLALDICNGTRPEISEKEAPKCYIELMKRCWDSNPDNRPDVAEIHDKIRSLYDFCVNSKNNESYATEIRKQFKEAENYRKLPYSSFKKNKQHPQAIYTTRLLNPFTKDLQNSECLSCAITDN